MNNKNIFIIIAVTAIIIASVVTYAALSGAFNGTSNPSPTPSSSATPTPSPSSSGTGTAITVTSNVAGTNFVKVDGNAVTTPASFTWEVGSTHTLTALSPVAASDTKRYVWANWSDGGAITHTYTVTSSSATVTANFKTQYQIVFAQTGIDSSASEDIVTVTTDGTSQAQSYNNLPANSWVNAGTQVAYSFESNVSTTCEGAFFMLTSSESSTFTVDAATTLTGTYKRTIIDANGNAIDVPAPSNINRIADSWPAHNTILVMCGAKEKLVATATVNTVNPMFRRILPAIETMLTPFNSDGTVNIESLLAEDPDIVFVFASGEDAAAAMESAGLVVVRLQFYDFTDMVHTVRLTGWILGQEAYTKALAYIDYFNGVYNKVSTRTSQIAVADRPLVLHLTGNSLVSIDAGGGLINTWINLCGGNNAAAEVSGNMVTVSLEQILTWNPELILIGSANANTRVAEIMSDSQWSEVTAVINGDVMANPMGVFDWARYSVEEALNIQWVAKTLHPTLFSDINIRTETAYFYSTFYEYTLSEAEIDAILSNTTPP